MSAKDDLSSKKFQNSDPRNAGRSPRDSLRYAAQMSRRFKSATMKFGVPLALPTSRRVLHCYASHGKAYGFALPRSYPCAVRILAVNGARETRWEDGVYEEPHRWKCPALAGHEEWRRLGWAMPDGSQPFGELDGVDPNLAQFNYLPPANSPSPSLGQST